MVFNEPILENKSVIPFFGIKRQYANLREEILHATDKVYESGQVLDGVHTSLFERSIADRCNRQFAISVNSCTQGLIMALQTISTSKQVLIPAVSFAATVNSVLMTELTPKFVDVDFNALIDLESVDSSLNVTGSAVMYANLFGNIVNYDRFRVLTEFFGNDTFVIEDAAQSFGAYYKGIPSGKLGDVSVLSFDPTKNLPNYGSGGMILTDDYDIAEALLDFRDNGKHSGHSYPGTNSKMSESDCAQMLVKLQYFDRWQKRRTAIADYYIEQLHPYVDILLPNKDVEHAWHKFVLRVDSRSKLKHHLAINGVDTRIHYEQALSNLDVSLSFANGLTEQCTMAEQFCKETLSLPIHPELTDSEVEHVAQQVREFYW
jgi:dTDP-4-amino-4,6-dideoxygalactose transaminase